MTKYASVLCPDLPDQTGSLQNKFISPEKETDVYYLEPITNIQWGPNVTLAWLCQSWLDQNELNVSDAIDALKSAGVRGAGNLRVWLNNEPTNNLLTSMIHRISEVMFSVDAWIMCEAKRMAIADDPDLAEEMPWNTYTTREELVEGLRTWKEMYGGSTHYLALQAGTPPRSTNSWTGNNTRLPGLEAAARMIPGVVLGQFMAVDCKEDAIIRLMARAITGTELETLIPGVTDFSQAKEALFSPFVSHTLAATASKTGIPAHRLATLRDWNKERSANSLPPESIESVLEALVFLYYGSDAANELHDRLKVYRNDEGSGVWGVANPLRLENPKLDPRRTREQKPDTPTAEQPDDAFLQRSAIGQPTAPSRDVRLPTPPLRTRSEPVSTDRSMETPRAKEPTQTECEQPTPQKGDAAHPITMFQQHLANICAFAAKELGDTGEQSEQATAPMRHVLTRETFDQHPTKGVSSEQLRQIRQLIETLRGELNWLCGLDHEYLTSVIRPVLGPELAELFVSTEGLKHLLPTPEAWKVIEATQQAMHFTPKNTNDNED